MNIKEKIIDYIKKNRVSTTEIADCLGKSGVLEDVYPITNQCHRVGEIRYTYAIQESNWSIHETLIESCEGKVVFIDAIDVNNRALIGELVTKYAILYQGAVAIVANGKMRDAQALIKEKYPVWCTGVSPVGCFNKPIDTETYNHIIEEHRAFYEGAILVCDDSGVVLIPKEQLDERFYEKLEAIEEQEDIWFECIDRFKMNTFDTVCLKKYLDKKE